LNLPSVDFFLQNLVNIYFVGFSVKGVGDALFVCLVREVVIKVQGPDLAIENRLDLGQIALGYRIVLESRYLPASLIKRELH
jgi:hypothetical protein